MQNLNGSDGPLLEFKPFEGEVDGKSISLSVGLESDNDEGELRDYFGYGCQCQAFFIAILISGLQLIIPEGSSFRRFIIPKVVIPNVG